MDQYFTLDGLLKLSGAITAVTMVTAMVGKLFGPRAAPRLIWVAAVLSLLLGLLGAAMAEGTAIKWVVSLFNGAVIFLASVGGNELAANRTPQVIDVTPEALPDVIPVARTRKVTTGYRDAGTDPLEPDRHFFTSWLGH